MYVHSVDPEPNAPSIDRVQKLRNQQEVRMEVFINRSHLTN